uniref:C2H2-type domain-containing protein n=1 Tax=Timema shepardi TaxID=629360 RepID=A0A7R9G0D7_TIMSH|nr:unnamed protein product [Timema shepardi]
MTDVTHIEIIKPKQSASRRLTGANRVLPFITNMWQGGEQQVTEPTLAATYKAFFESLEFMDERKCEECHLELLSSTHLQYHLKEVHKRRTVTLEQAADCWTKMANEKQVSMASEQTHAAAEEIVTLTSSSVSTLCAKLTRRDDVWCVDSGATTHMCRDKNSFLELTPTISQKGIPEKTSMNQSKIPEHPRENRQQPEYKYKGIPERTNLNQSKISGHSRENQHEPE